MTPKLTTLDTTPSRISPGVRVDSVDQVLTRGDVVTVEVTEVDTERGRVGLKLVSKQENGAEVPAETIGARYKEQFPNAGQGGPLGVKVEIGAGVARGVPHGVDGLVKKLQRQPGIERQRQQRQRPAHRLALAGVTLQPDVHRLRDTVADLQAGNAFLFHVLDRAQIGALAEMG